MLDIDETFAKEMSELEIETVKKIYECCKKYSINPLVVLHIFGVQLTKAAADMQAECNKNINKENTKGGNV